MLNKGMQYYLSTILLKIKAIVFSLYQNDNERKYFDRLWSRYFIEKKIDLNASFDWQFYSLSIYSPPDKFKEVYHFDDKMIPMCRKDFKQVFYNPLAIAQYGLINFNNYLKTNENELLITASNMIDFLLQKSSKKKNALLFPYNIDYQKFSLKAPWYSAISQAHVLSLMIRLYKKEPKDHLKEEINLVYNSLILPLCEGGFLSQTPEGYLWIEEYPSEHNSYVLNGFIFCIIALYEFQLAFPEKDINNIIFQLTESLIKSLHHYKRGQYWRYSRLNNTLSNIDYQGLHVNLFKHLWALTNNEAYKILYEIDNKHMNWKAYERFYRLNPK